MALLILFDNCIGSPIEKLWESVQYSCDLDKHVGNLKDACTILETKLEDLTELVEQNRASRVPIGHEVELWVSMSEERLKKAKEFLHELEQQEQQSSCWAFVGKLDCICRCIKSRKAKRHEDEVNQMINTDPRRGREVIATPGMPQISRLGPTLALGYEEMGSRRELIQTLKRALVDDKKLAVGVYGEEDAGKTMLVEKLVQELENSSAFKNIIIIHHGICGENVNTENGLFLIQKNIGERIGFVLNPDTTVFERKRKVLDAIERQSDKVLIIIDNLNEKISLESICIKWPKTQDSTCRIVVVSRDELVCKDMGSGLNFEVQRLSKQESWNFFEILATDYLQLLQGFNQIIEYPQTRILAREGSWSPGQIKKYFDTLKRLIDQLKMPQNRSLMIPPVACRISHIGRAENWEWSTSMEAVLKKDYYLEIKGVARTEWLYSNATYDAYFVYKLTDQGNKSGFDKTVVQLMVEKEIKYCYLEPITAAKAEQKNTHITERDDGYMEIHMGNFQVKESSHRSINLYVREEIFDNRLCGLVFRCIDLRLLSNR